MSVLVEYVLGSPILMESLATVEDTHVTLVQEDVPRDTPARLTFWAVGDTEAFEAAMREDSTVGEFARIATAQGRSLYRIDVAEKYRSRLTYPVAVEVDGIFVSTVGRDDGWHIRARFPSRAAFTTYLDACAESGFSVELERIYTSSGDDAAETKLTPQQREALEVALEEGYFDIPRQATTSDLGEELGISGQAVSERLRRALETAAELAVEDDLG